MKTVSIVGDKFAEFAKQGSAFTASAVEAMLENGPPELDLLRFELGQGVAFGRALELLTRAERVGRRAQFLFEPFDKCGTKHVHKLRPENSMIEVPRRVSRDTYESRMHIDDRCEILSDHITGKHLPGMVLIEAARQMCLAVTEEFYGERFPRGLAFLWNSFSIEFQAYAFPLRMRVEYQVCQDASKGGRGTSFDTEIRFFQRDALIACAKMGVDVRDRAATERIEASLALAATRVA